MRFSRRDLFKTAAVATGTVAAGTVFNGPPAGQRSPVQSASEPPPPAFDALNPSVSLAFERIQRRPADFVHQLARLALCRNEKKPAPRDHAVRVKAEDVSSDRIAMMMIAKKPAVELAARNAV